MRGWENGTEWGWGMRDEVVQWGVRGRGGGERGKIRKTTRNIFFKSNRQMVNDKRYGVMKWAWEGGRGGG